MVRRMIFFAVLALGLPGMAQAQTALGLSVEGVQTIVLNDQVGKNQIQFVSAAPLEEIRGTATGVTGTLTLDPTNLETLTGHIEVPVAQMETGIKKRDAHLHSKDWLNAETFPKIAFDITGLTDISVKAEGEKATIKGVAVGKFILHGVTKALNVPFEGTYLLASEQTKKRAPGDLFAIQGHFKIALKDFDILGARGMVGSRVGTEIDLNANFFGSSAMATKE